MPKRMVSPHLSEISGVDHPAHLVEGWLLMKSAGQSPKGSQMPALTKEARESLTPEARAYVESLEGTVAKAASTDEDAEAFEKAVAALPEPARAALLKQQREAVEATAMAKALWNEREDGRFETIAKSLSHLPTEGGTKAFAKSLREVAESVDEPVFEGILKTLRGADAALAQAGFFKEIGSSNDSEGGTGSAQDQILAFAKELVKADPDLSHAEAVEKAAFAHPELAGSLRSQSLARNSSVEA